jgi:hypothetical protein
MPAPYCFHPCLGAGVRSASPTCPDCGAEGSFVGWSRRMHEGMALYQYLYGLVPIGPHRPLARELFRSSRKGCVRCGGEGIVTVDESSWLMCWECEGTGGFWTISEEEVEVLRFQVLSEFPEAGARAGPTGFLSGPLIQNLETGEIVGSPDGDDGERDARRPPGLGSAEAAACSPSNPPSGAATDQTLVYRLTSPGNSLVFATLERARDVSRMHAALKESRTWGEFRQRLPVAAWEDFGEALEEYGRDAGDEEPFSIDEFPIASDGDFPPWLQTEQAHVLPSEILEEYGTLKSSMLNGHFWALDPEREQEILMALRGLGYEVLDSEAAGGLIFW